MTDALAEDVAQLQPALGRNDDALDRLLQRRQRPRLRRGHRLYVGKRLRHVGDTR